MITDYIEKRTANVYGIYGHLGGGKTLTAVEISLWALSLGWTVTSNVELFHLEHLKGKYNFIRDIADVDFWQLPCGAPRGSTDKFRSVIILDECAEFFDQYSGNAPIVKNFLSWLRHSSKRGQFVFLIVQQPEFINKSLRLLVNKWIVCQDMEQFYFPVLHFRIPFTRDLVWRRMFDKYGNLLSRGWNFADKRIIGRHYNTAQSIALQGRGSDYASRDDNVSYVLAPLLKIILLFELVKLFCFY